MNLPEIKPAFDNLPKEEGVYDEPLFYERSTFHFLFLVLVILLMFMPFVTTFNELLTKLVERAAWYSSIQDLIVPYLVRMVSVILSWLGVLTDASRHTITVRQNVLIEGGTIVYISWNCIGWQSFLLFLLTLITGLQGNYSKRSKFITIVFGLLGTFWINVFRISVIVLIAHWWGRLPAVLFHDYGSTLLIIVWLFIFWWVSYHHILEK